MLGLLEEFAIMKMMLSELKTNVRRHYQSLDTSLRKDMWRLVNAGYLLDVALELIRISDLI